MENWEKDCLHSGRSGTREHKKGGWPKKDMKAEWDFLQTNAIHPNLIEFVRCASDFLIEHAHSRLTT